MSLLDILRQEYVTGRVIDKYKLQNGNVGLIVEDEINRKRYHVEFKGQDRDYNIQNLFGFFKYPFDGKTEHVDRLIKKGDSVELTLSYSKGPLREAYYIHSVSGPKPHPNPHRLIDLPYKSVNSPGY